MMYEPFEVVQLWDSTLLPEHLALHVQRDLPNGSLHRWTVRGEHGPHDDPGYGPTNYSERDMRYDREVDDYLVERGADVGSTIVWHVWW